MLTPCRHYTELLVLQGHRDHDLLQLVGRALPNNEISICCIVCPSLPANQSGLQPNKSRYVNCKTSC